MRSTHSTSNAAVLSEDLQHPVMSLWFFIKVIAALLVMAVMALTGMLAYHVTIKPLGGVFEKIIPNPSDIVRQQPDEDFANMLDSAELPDIDPGEKAFQKAHELLALGNLGEAREKLTTIINLYPSSSSAPLARRIVGDMNLDEMLSTAHMEGKKNHVVKRGNTYLGIAAGYQTNMDLIMHLNGMMDLKNLQPGDELIVMPLNLRILIEPQRKSLSLWEGGRFIREYPILHVTSPATLTKQITTIGSKLADFGGKKIQSTSKDYRGAHKIIQLTKPKVQIIGYDGPAAEVPHGIVLSVADMEEISLLTRPGNEVEIR